MGHTDGYVEGHKHDAPLRGVSRDYTTPIAASSAKASGKPRAGASGKAGSRARSADDVLGDEPSERPSGLSSRGNGGGLGRKPSFDPTEETELGRAAKKRFGDKVGPVIHAHLHLMGVDTEDDLR
jgi:hypothetical protein